MCFIITKGNHLDHFVGQKDLFADHSAVDDVLTNLGFIFIHLSRINVTESCLECHTDVVGSSFAP